MPTQFFKVTRAPEAAAATAQEIKHALMNVRHDTEWDVKEFTKIDAAFGRLADMIPSGHLLAGTDPVGFLDTIATELKDLRAENVKLRDRISELEACIRQMCNNALDLGYCDMRDCHDCKTFKVCGVEE